MTDVLVVIVNYRVAGLVVDCLRSLEAEVAARSGLRVVVTDNGSGDDSVPQLEAAVRAHGWGGWVEVRPLARNGGFAHGNNEGVRPALASADPPRYVVLLNPDTVVRPGAIGTLVDFMDAHPRVGIAGARLEHHDGTPQNSAFRFHSVLSELEEGARLGPLSRLLGRSTVRIPVPESAVQVDWVAGACMIVRRAVFEAVGLFDEAYFMYFEEVDFCHRARRAGWPCWYVPESRVVHLVGKSSGVTDAARTRMRRPPYWFDSRRRYLRATLGPARAFLADLLWSAGYASYRVRRVLQRKPDKDPERLLGDFVAHSFLRAGR